VPTLGNFTVALVLAGVLAGCNRGSEISLTDTEGRKFAAKCNGEGHCELARTAGPGQDSTFSLVASGRLLAVCGAEASAAECRPLVCSGDGACPPAQGLQHGTCVNGLCVEPSHELTTDDSVMLCLAGTGLGKSSPAQVERFALGLNCGSPCKVPRTCRQP
jgi:hypothetical protein